METNETPTYPEGRDLLKGKNVVITAAAGSGIGFATAKRCAEEGARVLLSDTHENRLAESVSLLQSRQFEAYGIPCDVTKENEVQEYSWDKPRGEVGELPIVKDVGFGEGLVFESTGKQDDRWYNWRVANWGTKWDCYDLSIDEDEQELNLQFNTAWSPPEEICRALKEKFEDADIQWFYDEPGMEFAGYL